MLSQSTLFYSTTRRGNGTTFGALSTRTGSIKWTIEPSAYGQGPSMVLSSDSSTLFASVCGQQFGPGSGASFFKVFALHAESGEQKWALNVSTSTPGASDRELCPYLTVSPDGKTLFAAATNITAISTAEGQELWSQDSGCHANSGQGQGQGPVAVSSDSKTVFAGDGAICALNAADGTVSWQSAPPEGTHINSVFLSPDERHLYLTTVHCNIHYPWCQSGALAVDATNGAGVWNFTACEAPTMCEHPVAVLSSDGKTLYLGSQDNYLHAVSTADGGKEWSYKAGDWVSSLAVSSKEPVVYMWPALNDPYITAIETA